jgi:hypothetical protein
METTEITKADDFFTTEVERESIGFNAAVTLVSGAISKALETDGDEAIDRGKRAFCFMSEIEKALESDEETEEVSIPCDVLKAIQSDSEGATPLTVPITKALTSLGEKLNPASDSEEETTDEVIIKEDVSEVNWSDVTDDPGDSVDWGDDPAGL